jgi:hypothetical protein
LKVKKQNVQKEGAFLIVAHHPVALNPYLEISTILVHC